MDSNLMKLYNVVFAEPYEFAYICEIEPETGMFLDVERVIYPMN